MATTIKLKNGSGAPLAGDLVQGEPALDLTNKRLYTENASGTIIEVGTNPTSLTTGTFTSTGIDDNATSTAITIDASENVGIGTTSPSFPLGTGLHIDSSGYTSIVLQKGSAGTGHAIEFTDENNTLQYRIGTNFASGGQNLLFAYGSTPTVGMALTSAGNVGIGTTSPGYKLHVAGEVYSAGRSTGYGYRLPDWRMYNETDNSIVWTSGGTERMRIDSSGRVGIGIAPSYTLDIQAIASSFNPVRFSGHGSSIDAFLYTDTAYWSIGDTAGYGGNLWGGNKTSNFIHAHTNGAERMRIDSSGDVLIGTSATSYLNAANRQVCHVNGGTDGAILALTGTASGSYPGSTGDFYIASGASGTTNTSLVTRSNGYMNFYTNNTERMRIDSSGNVSIGATTSNNRKLSVTGTGDLMELRSTNAGAAGAQLDLIHNSASPADGDSIGIINFANASAQFANITAKSSSVSSLYGELHFGTRNAGTYNFSNMVLDSSGNVGIGIAPVSGYGRKLQVHSAAGGGSSVHITDSVSGSTASDGLELITFNSAAYIWNRESSFMSLGTGATERMRIDSSGNVLVGTTTTVGTGVEGVQIGTNGAITTGRNQTSDQIHHVFKNPNGTVGTIRTLNNATSYVTSSDQRLKENIVDAPAGNIDAIRVRSFDWKADGTHQTYGMVAQELVDVAPAAVSQGETEEDMWGVDYSKLVPMMIKEIQDLRARVAQLEGA